MELADLLTPQRTFTGVEAGSKKRLLETIAQLLHEAVPELGADDLFTSLTTRERLGTTGLGFGVAIPHCRIDSCTAPVGALFRLHESVDFDAVDGDPVDLLFVLVVPEEATQEHLNALAAIAERLGDRAYRDRLREAGSAEQMFDAALGAA